MVRSGKIDGRVGGSRTPDLFYGLSTLQDFWRILFPVSFVAWVRQVLLACGIFLSS